MTLLEAHPTHSTPHQRASSATGRSAAARRITDGDDAVSADALLSSRGRARPGAAAAAAGALPVKQDWRELPVLRGYQRQAVDAMVSGLAGGGRGQLVAACGSGKTLVALHAAVRLCPSGVVVLACPSLALVAQSLREWTRAGVVREVLAVCSDDTVADAAVHAGDLECPVTTDAAQVAEWLRERPAGRLRLLLVTHVSAAVAGAGLVKADEMADLLVVDEAHRTAGLAGKTFGRLHHDEWLPARRRLYMTATPRIMAAGRRGAAVDGRQAVSMDDPAVFGPVLFRYQFAAAIDDGWLDDYQVAAIGVTGREVLKLLHGADPQAVPAAGHAPLHTLVVQAALARAAVEFGLRRVLVFTPRIADSKQFTRTLARTLGLLPAEQQPGRPLTAAHVDGSHTVTERGRQLRRLADPPDDGWTVLSSARCLGEGVDVPAVDAVLFTRPKKSEVDVVQAVGRALRRNPHGTGTATVLVPVLLPDDPGRALDDLGEWATLWQVLRALRAHDGRLAAALDTQRGQAALDQPVRIPEQVLLRLPDGYTTEQVLRHITIRVLERTTSIWPAGHAALTAFRHQHGHVRVPRPYRVGDLDLSSWVRYQVERHRAGLLPADQADALRALGVRLESPADSWDRGLAAARAFHHQHGHLHPPATLRIDGIGVYDWLKRRRNAHREGRLPADQAAALAALDPTWHHTKPRPTGQQGLAAATAFYAEHGHLHPPRGTTVDGVNLSEWLTHRRALLHADRLPDDHRRTLDALDATWARRHRVDFADGLAAARAFYTAHGHLRPPTGQRVRGITLQAWLAGIRRKYHAGTLPRDQIAALEDVGIVWSTAQTSWERGLAAARAYHHRTGHLRAPRHHRENGVALATWLQRQRRQHATGQLPAERITALEELGIAWTQADHRRSQPHPR